jgi:hypothetical protein
MPQIEGCENQISDDMGISECGGSTTGQYQIGAAPGVPATPLTAADDTASKERLQHDEAVYRRGVAQGGSRLKRVTQINLANLLNRPAAMSEQHPVDLAA